jgi:ATP-dependent Zn protease
MDILRNRKTLNKKRQNKNRIPGLGGSPLNVFTKIANAILIILFISVLYSMIFTGENKPEQISISQLANDISAGMVQKVEVKGDNLTITYNSTSTVASSTEALLVKEAKKEEGVALTQSLFNYKVPEEALSKVNIDIVSDTGFGYWFLNLAPFILPFLLI